MSGSRSPRILLIRLRSLGDLVLITPCTRAVKEALPDCRLAVAVDEGCEDLFLGSPYVEEVLSSPLEGSWGRWLGFLRDLRRRFDWVFNLHGGPRSAQMVLASGASRRVGGLQKPHPWNRVYNVRVRPFSEILGGPGPFHIVERHLATLRCGGIEGVPGPLVIPVQQRARETVRRRLEQAGVGTEQGIVVLHPIPSGGTNRWGSENFSALAGDLSGGRRLLPVFIGGAGDRAEVEGMVAAVRGRALNWCGETSLGELAALLERCALFVGVDSGPSHLAAGVGAPVVVLWGTATLTTWHPWTPRLAVVGGAAGEHETRIAVRRVAAGREISEIRVDDVREAVAALEVGADARVRTR